MENQTCENCKNFVRYYVIFKDRFRPVDSGFCALRISKKIKMDFCCEKWQEGKSIKEEAIKTTHLLIQDTNKRLNNIYKVLKTLEDEQS